MKDIILNSDWCNFFTFPMEKMSKEGIWEEADFYTKDTDVKIMIYNITGASCFCNAGPEEERFGAGFCLDEHDELAVIPGYNPVFPPKSGPLLGSEQMVKAFLKLMRDVPDFMEQRYQRCHENGSEMWVGFRMNDVHHTDYIALRGAFESAHPEYARVTYRKNIPGYFTWPDHTLDYSIPEVFDFELKIVQSCLDAYPCDGIELDWMRTPPHFSPAVPHCGREILTAFMRKVKELVVAKEQRTHTKIRICVRCDSSIEASWLLGLDVSGWAKEGLVDIVSPSIFFTTTDSRMPVRTWKNILPSHVIVAPTINDKVSFGFPLEKSLACGSPETDCALAAYFDGEGADMLYLFNHYCTVFGGYRDKQLLKKYLGILGDPKKFLANERRYRPTFAENMTEIEKCVPYLPAVLQPECLNTCMLNVGNGTENRQAWISIATSPLHDMEVRMNTVLCPRLEPNETMYEGEAMRFQVPEGALYNGENLIEFRTINTDKNAEMLGLELVIK